LLKHAGYAAGILARKIGTLVQMAFALYASKKLKDKLLLICPLYAVICRILQPEHGIARVTKRVLVHDSSQSFGLLGAIALT
jgi:hypothetical protein